MGKDKISISKNSARQLLFAGLGLAACLFSNCSKSNSGQPAREARAPVTVAQVSTRDIPVQIGVIGNVESMASVEVKSQVSGYLTGIYFAEGQELKKDDLLFEIDPRPFQQELAQLSANLARDRAQLANAEVENKRYEELFQRELVSREQYDQARTQAEALSATVKADQAALFNARLTLSYCTIRAPITGRAGSLNFHKGDLVRANDTTALVTINQLQPIYVSFAVPEQHLSEIKNYMASGPLKVLAVVPSQSRPAEQGILTFIDNAIDPATGTIKLKATFENPEKNLWPGQFVNVTLELTERPNALVVPTQAILTGQNGQYLYVVKPEGTVESRPVVTSISYQNDTVVDKGLSAGETIVIDGQLQLKPGARVEVKNAAAANATGSAPAGAAHAPGSSAGTGAK